MTAKAKALMAEWRKDIGQVVKYERMESEIAAALATAQAEGHAKGQAEQREADAVKCDEIAHNAVSAEFVSNKAEQRAVGADECAAAIRREIDNDTIRVDCKREGSKAEGQRNTK